MLRRQQRGRRAGVLALAGGCLALGLSVLAAPAGAQVTGIDTPPPTGSGGFYNASGPITKAVTGQKVSLVVTVEQTGATVSASGYVKLAWNPADFQLDGTGSDASGQCTTGSGSLTCQYVDLAHTYKSVAYSFIALGPDSAAKISATAQTDGAAQTASFSLDIRPPLAIDAPPPAGTGGWYGANGKPITSAQPGAHVSLTVTALQPGTEYADGNFTLSWNPADFTFVSNSDPGGACVSSSGSVSCAYTDLAHAAKSDAFHFTATGPDPKAAVVAKVTVNGYSATYTFPLAITSASAAKATSAPTSKASCKKGGWRSLSDDAGHGFKNQGDCVSFVATRGRHGGHHGHGDHGHGHGHGHHGDDGHGHHGDH